VTPAVANNMFTIATAAVAPATVTADLYRINRRYTLITSIVAREVTAAPVTIDTTVAVVIKPDNRSQFIGSFTYNDAVGVPVVGSLTGHINYDTGIFTYNIVYSGGTGTSTYSTVSAVLSMRFMPTNTMNGRVRVKIETEMTDVRSNSSVAC
jgi:hypothetical protein